MGRSRLVGTLLVLTLLTAAWVGLTVEFATRYGWQVAELRDQFLHTPTDTWVEFWFVLGAVLALFDGIVLVGELFRLLMPDRSRA